MFELIRRFEQSASELDPNILIIIGTASVLIGLFLLLAGLKFEKTAAGVVGAFGGGVFGSLVVGHNFNSVFAFGVIACVVAVILKKVFIKLQTIGLVMAFGLLIVMQPYINQANEILSINQQCEQKQAESANIEQIIKTIEAYTKDMNISVDDSSTKPVYKLVIVVASGLVLMAAVMALPRLTSALSCAVLGVLFASGGLFLLFSFKDIMPADYISRRKFLCLGLFAAVIVLSTVGQLLLYRNIQNRVEAKKDSDEIPEEPSKEVPHWRSI